MLANCKLQRAVAVPLRTASAKYILAKLVSSKSGDDDEEGKNNANDFFQYCLSCDCPTGCDSNTICYDARKYGHCLPHSTRCPNFDPLPNIPTDIFRCTAGERLGPRGQASKCGQYINPEYFSYHHMSYYDLQYVLRQFKKCCPDTDRKPL